MHKAIVKEIYLPREDSELLLSCVRPQNGKKFLDMGTGSGIIGIHAAKKGAIVTATDVSAEALSLARENARGANAKMRFVRSDLFARLRGKFDFIAFNPPYVPSGRIKWMDTDGGKGGREVLDRFLREFPRHLSRGGKCWFLQSSLNGQRKTEGALRKARMKFGVVGRKKLFFEELLVYEVGFSHGRGTS